MRRQTAVLLLTFFSATALSACAKERIAQALPTPADKLVCDAAGTRPSIPPEYAIDWAKVTTVAQATAEHDKYVAAIRTREGVIAAYIMSIEGKLFVCSNNMQWRKDFEKALAHG